jgi:hypothetical protein
MSTFGGNVLPLQKKQTNKQKKKELQWYGHVIRMAEERKLKQI